MFGGYKYSHYTCIVKQNKRTMQTQLININGKEELVLSGVGTKREALKYGVEIEKGKKAICVCFELNGVNVVSYGHTVNEAIENALTK